MNVRTKRHCMEDEDDDIVEEEIYYIYLVAKKSLHLGREPGRIVTVEECYILVHTEPHKKVF